MRLRAFRNMHFCETRMRTGSSEIRKIGFFKTIMDGPFRSSTSAKPWKLIRSIYGKVSYIGSKTRCNRPRKENGLNALRESILKSATVAALIVEIIDFLQIPLAFGSRRA